MGRPQREDAGGNGEDGSRDCELVTEVSRSVTPTPAKVKPDDNAVPVFCCTAAHAVVYV